MTRRIYLDYCATTPVHPSVRNRMLRVLDTNFGNPSSMHWAGGEARELVDEARAQTASGINCRPGEIIFTSGATESDNLALSGTLRRFDPQKAHLITSSIEHHAILHAAQRLEHDGYAVTYLPVDSHGVVDPRDVLAAIRPETKLISVMYVNNETGSVQPVAEIGRIARENGILFHTDAVQATGLFDVNMDELKADMLSLSAHKIYGPKGVGALYLRAGIELMPLMLGGPQENRLRAGTENVPGIAGLGAAMELVKASRAPERQRLLELRRYLINGLQAMDIDFVLNGQEQMISPHIASISFPGVNAEMMLIRLTGEGIAVSMGSACNAESIEPSHVLTAMGQPRERIESTLRISLGMYTTQGELDVLLNAIERVLPRVLAQ